MESEVPVLNTPDDRVAGQIDITKPYRYGGGSRGTDLANPGAERIVNLQYMGMPINMNQEFIVIVASVIIRYE